MLLGEYATGLVTLHKLHKDCNQESSTSRISSICPTTQLTGVSLWVLLTLRPRLTASSTPTAGGAPESQTAFGKLQVRAAGAPMARGNLGIVVFSRLWRARSADGDFQAARVGGSPRSFRSQALERAGGRGGAVDDARKDTWETGRCARSGPAVAAEMEEGGKAPVQPQQPPATSPGGGDEKPSGKERRDAGDKDKEQELVRRGPGSRRRRRPRAESRRPRRPRTRLPTDPPAPGEGR